MPICQVKKAEQLNLESLTWGNLTWVNIEEPTERETEYLAQNYGSSIAKRALWSWGGGVEKDVDYDLLPWDSWKLMLDKAGKTPISKKNVSEAQWATCGY